MDYSEIREDETNVKYWSNMQCVVHSSACYLISPFRRRHIQLHFLEWKYMNFVYDFIEVSSGSNLQYSSIGSDDGLSPMMAWPRPGDKSLSDAYMRHTSSMS